MYHSQNFNNSKSPPIPLYNLSQTARLTNSINKTGLNSFNKWGGISFNDILKNYPPDLIDRVWSTLSTFIIENYQMGKGTFIKGFGTFTFSNIEYSLEGTTNQYERDIKRRRPVFLVSNEFVDYLKPGMYNEKSGLMYYTQKINNNISIVKVNYAILSYGINISKEEYVTIVTSIIKNIGDEIRRGVFKGKYMENLGTLIQKGNVFGMRFDLNIYNKTSLKTNELFHTKKNIKLYMETKDSDGTRIRNINNIDKQMRNIRPKSAVITKISPSGDTWLQNNMNIDVKKIYDEPRDDLFIEEPKNKKEYYVDQRYYRKYPQQDLGNLKISQDILEGILNNKSLLLREIKSVDLHGDGLIPKYDFINAFHKCNVHHNLRIELIEKITDLYINYDPSIIMIHYNNLINALCDDIKKIVSDEYKNFPIDKYKDTIQKNNKRAQSAYAYSSNSGNLGRKALSNVNNYNNFVNVNEDEVKYDILKIKRICNYLNKNTNKMISYLELKSILQTYMISLNKVQILKILKFFDIKNPNAFNLRNLLIQISQADFNKKVPTINQKDIDNALKILQSFLDNKGGVNYLFSNYDIIYYPEFENLCKDSGISPNILKATFDYIAEGNKFFDKNNYLKYLINKQDFDSKKNCEDNINDDQYNFNIKAINIILNKIHSMELTTDKYFEHLLAYNICRKANVIYLDELERLFQLENYDFTINEIRQIFNFMDYKKDNIIDRQEFNKTLNSVPYPLTTYHNFIKSKKITIEDACYKLGIDLFTKNINEVLNSHIDRQIFNIKMGQFNDNFHKEFLYELFNAMNTENKPYLTVQQIIDFTNIYRDNEYKNIDAVGIHKNIIYYVQNLISFNELIEKFQKFDKTITKKIPLNQFLIVYKDVTKNKMKEKDILRFLRMNRLIDRNDIVEYHRFARLIFENYIDDPFINCIHVLHDFLKKECSDDLFIFFVKINNMPDNSNINKTLDLSKLYEFFRSKVEMCTENTIKKFDYDNDGIISYEDMENIIKKYIDPSYFDNIKAIREKRDRETQRSSFLANKKIWNLIKIAIKKINMTEEKLFFYLDQNKDGYIGLDEFTTQISKLPLNTRLTQKQIKTFYNYLDEFLNEKVNIHIFLKKFRIFKDDYNETDEKIYKGNFVIENLILSEFTKWFQKNNNLSDTEVYSILDKDHDGIISANDFKHFALNSLLLSPSEINENKILHFINAVSLTRNDNLVLADIRNLMEKINLNDLDDYYKYIREYCNRGVNKFNKDPNWLKEVCDKLGYFISEKYDNNIHQFYNENNINDFKNNGKGISLNDFRTFLESNYKLFDNFQMEKPQSEVFFNYLSNNTPYITIQSLNKIFGNNKYDFYTKMHNDILIFLNENFPSSEDAFKYFHNIKPISESMPTYNDKTNDRNYITKSEFFNGINQLFPKKYETNTILNYIQKTFPNIINDISFSEFTLVYFNKYEFNDKFSKTQFKNSKILTSRPHSAMPFMTLNSPFIQKEHKDLETPFDNDPLEKIKRLILSSKYDFKTIFKDFISQSGNGMANQFEFRNLIKKLDLGLTNIEIEDIINKSGITVDGRINLYDFYNYITNEEQNLHISKENILNQLKIFKQYFYKYYSNPRLAFELNDPKVIGKIDFDKFKKIIFDMYQREGRQLPNYNLMKYIYDYIDIRKDGVIDLNEWNKVFAQSEGTLDLKANKNQMKILRNWETSKEISDIYKLIARNKKIIKEKVKMFSYGNGRNGLVIQSDNMVKVLKDVLGNLKLSYTQWKMLVSCGDRDKSGMIDFDTFMKVVEASANFDKSHPIPNKVNYKGF